MSSSDHLPEPSQDVTRALLQAARVELPEERFEDLHGFGLLVRRELDRLLDLDLGESFPAASYDPRWTR